MRRNNVFSTLFLFFVFVIDLKESAIFAGEVLHLMRSPRALLMGDAVTAIAEDEYSLFYNPAALARNTGVQFSFLNPVVGVTNALDEMDRFEDFPKEATEISDRILGFPVFIQLGAAPSLKFGPFGISLFANQTSSLILRDSIYPVLEINHRLDRGAIFGFAYTFGQSPRLSYGNQSMTKGKRLSVGISAKTINRQGIEDSFDLYGTKMLNAIERASNSEDSGVTELREELGFSKGKGVGADLGLEAVQGNGTTEFALGMSILDIGGTRFRRTSGINEVPDQNMLINLGSAFRQNFMFLDYTFSADLHPVNQGLPFARMMHLGVEIGLPIVRFLAGWNGGYVSYGASIKVWPIRITAGFYGIETGANFRQEKGSRAVIAISLFETNFDL